MTGESLRLAETLGALTLATDLAAGLGNESALKVCLVATATAREMSVSGASLKTVYNASLLRFLGCTAFASEEGPLSAGDDIGLRRTLAMVDFGSFRSFAGRAVRGIASHASLPVRARALARLLADPSTPARHAVAQCEVGAAFARAIGIDGVAEVLALRDERWDGRGPRGFTGGLPLPARIADVADVAELFAWHHGIGEAKAELGRRSAGQLDPDVVRAVDDPLWEGVFDPSVWELYLDAEPGPPRLATSPDEIGRVLEAWSLFADLASVFTLGHGGRVGRLCAAVAEAVGLGDDDRRLAGWAGWVHDLGRVGVPNGIWDKPGPLTPFERERVRLHSTYTETILRSSAGLAELADVATATHERASGRGYPRRLALEREPLLARIVAVADVYVALRSDRPHRPAFDPEGAARELRGMESLDRHVVDGVLAVQGHTRPRRAEPRGLTDREREVVRLVAIGRTNPEIGALLGMSPRTAQKHVMNVYDKLGIESRAALALYAVEHGLLDT